MNKFAEYVFIWVCLAFTNTANAQSPTESVFVLADIVAQLPGKFDNEPQIFLEQSFGTGHSGPHRRTKLEARLVGAAEKQSADFLVYLEENTLVERWRFSVDADLRGVRMRRFAIDDVPLWHSDLTQMPDGAPILCDHVWFEGQGSTYAEPIGEGCDTEAYNFLLSEEGLWVLNNSTTGGRLAPVQTDRIHTKLFRARRMECFVNILHMGQPADAGLEGRTLINPILLHDRGDTYEFQTAEEKPRKFILKLRRSMWPSRSGRNFVPMLILYLYKDRVADDAIAGSAWAAASSDRVAFDAGGIGARCKNAAPVASR